jgi:putative Mg2+ transporter-C (MgtC) family protein
MLEFTESAIRLIVALIFGVLIGYSRRRYPAGIRTFALICLGTTIFTIISISPNLDGASNVNIDPSRVISQIVTGIGFIGAGVIWKSQAKLGGITTAALVWAAAGLGVLVGLGEFGLATLVLIMLLAVIYSKKVFPDI